MIDSVMFWNEPNNMSHWNVDLDPGWEKFATMTRWAGDAVRRANPGLSRVLGGISPVDPEFIDLMFRQGVDEAVDVVAIHGFPVDWNPWQIHEWPAKVREIEAISGKPVWVTEVGVSSFGAEEVQDWGLQRTAELLLPCTERTYWYSLFDLASHRIATTRHKESEGSAYYRHFYFGLLNEHYQPKLALAHFPKGLGICQWVHWHDEETLNATAEWLERLGVYDLRTGISWADWHRPNAAEWFDHMMEKLSRFRLMVTLCFTPPSRGIEPNHTSPPVDLGEYAYFCQEIVERYAPPSTENEVLREEIYEIRQAS